MLSNRYLVLEQDGLKTILEIIGAERVKVAHKIANEI